MSAARDDCQSVIPSWSDELFLSTLCFIICVAVVVIIPTAVNVFFFFVAFALLVLSFNTRRPTCRINDFCRSVVRFRLPHASDGAAHSVERTSNLLCSRRSPPCSGWGPKRTAALWRCCLSAATSCEAGEIWAGPASVPNQKDEVPVLLPSSEITTDYVDREVAVRRSSLRETRCQAPPSLGH